MGMEDVLIGRNDLAKVFMTGRVNRADQAAEVVPMKRGLIALKGR
jgi:hypothetical protein